MLFNGDDGAKACSLHCSTWIFQQSAKMADGFRSWLKNMTHKPQPDNKDGNNVSHRPRLTTITEELPQNVMQLANVRKAVYGFSFANMEICRTHGLWGGSAAATHSSVRKLPDGNNESHKNGILISFQRKKRQVRPSSGPKTNSPAVVSSSE